MKYVTRTMAWGAAASLLLIWASITTQLPLFAQTRISENLIYPSFRFFESDRYSLATEKGLAEIFDDRLKSSKPVDTQKLARHLRELCKKHRLDPAFVVSLIHVESSFRADIVSPAGAVGLMQLMPATASYVAKKYKIPYRGPASLKDPMVNLTLGVRYLKELRDRYQGKGAYYHLAAYNMGPARLDELAARPTFKPNQTLKYYQNVMRGVDYWRYYSEKKLERRSKISRSVPETARPRDS